MIAALLIVAGLAVFSMLRPWGMGYGMMGRGVYGFNLFGGLAMGVMMLFPVLLVVGLVAGGIWLAGSLTRAVTDEHTSPAGGAACSNCSRSVQSDWQICPYCGQPLKN